MAERNELLDCIGKPIDLEASKCPLCGVVNMPWCDIAHLIPNAHSIVTSGHIWYYGDMPVTCGTACWDGPFGDTCGACRQAVLNTETALIGPNGMCHEDYPEEDEDVA